MAPIGISEFFDKLGEAIDNNVITDEQYDEFMYRCATTQAYKPSQLQAVMGSILNKISELENEKESNQQC